jgi:DNA polymerase I-like protein with 3'-5' exonuclease and polymerase domains
MSKKDNPRHDPLHDASAPFALERPQDAIQFDVETTGLQQYAGTQRAFMYQFRDREGNEAVLYPEKDRDEIQKWFDKAKNVGIMAWNSNFDRAWADAEGYDIPPDGMWLDGMLYAHILDENRSVALKSIADNLLGDTSSDLQKKVKDSINQRNRDRRKAAKEAGTEYEPSNYSDVEEDLMAEYGIEDVRLTQRVADIYVPAVEELPSLQSVVELEHDVMDAIFHIQKRGFPVDEQGYRKLEHEVVENLEILEARCDELAEGVENFSPRSSAKIVEALEKRGADMTHMKTSDKTGAISADVESLLTVEDELADAILKYRAEYKALSTYIRPMINRTYVSSLNSYQEQFISPDGRVHAGYRQLGARTGRMSSHSPNFQNQPSNDLRLKYNMRAEPGYKLVTCDLSNVEARIFAAYCGEGPLLKTIQDGGDIHQLTADMVGLRDRKRPDGSVDKARQRGKTFNFSVLYGGGIPTLMKQLRVDKKEARKLLNRYKEAYPEITRLQRRVAFKIEDQGFITSSWGRRFRVSDKETHKAPNYLVQGTAADLLKASLVRLHKMGAPIVALVHDEVVIHCKEEDAEYWKEQTIKCLTEHPRITDKVPLEAEGEIVDRWSQSKDPDFVPRWKEKELEPEVEEEA